MFFDNDDASLRPQSILTISQSIRSYNEYDNVLIEVTGHTDRLGDPQYNDLLSLRRAQAVRDEFVRQGVPALKVRTFGKGQRDPLVASPDGVAEPQNRRAEIHLIRSSPGMP